MRSIVKPTSAEVEVPIIDKRTAQVIALTPDTVQIMDMETYELYDVPIESGVADDIKDQLKEGINVEYWETLGRIKIMKLKGE